MELTAALLDLCKKTSHPIIAIDGPAGAGKTTLAQNIKQAMSPFFSSTVIHMDDLYHGWYHPFDDHFTDALTKIIASHQSGEPYRYSKFNWGDNRFGPIEEFPHKDLLILEGVGSSHKVIRSALTTSIWLTIDPQIGLIRVIERDGAASEGFMTSWLIEQEKQFIESASEECADFVLTTG